MLLPHHKSSCHARRSVCARVCVGWLDDSLEKLVLGALSKFVSQFVYYFFFFFVLLLRPLSSGREEKIIRRETHLKMCTYFTMWHHPKKLRNRKINAKNRAPREAALV